MAGVDRTRSLKDILLESLSAILSPDHNTRTEGENQIKALEVTEEFGVHLAELTVDSEGPLAIRQLASVLLKQYVEAHWSRHSDKFRPPETGSMAKQRIRELLPPGLCESVSKVRTSIAYAISAIAHWDWPETWPDLFQIMMQALVSGDPNAVHGAMRVLTEFSQDITDTQMSHVAPIILPELYKIFLQAEVYGVRTRGRAVHIFNICAGMIATMNEVQKGVAKQLLFPVLPQFTEALVQALQLPDSHTSDSGLKTEIVKAITTLVKCFPKTMNQWLNQMLPSVWSIFTQSAEYYVRTVVNKVEEVDDVVDSEGEILGFENLVYSVFEFVHGLIETSKFRSTVKKTVNDIIYYVVIYMQMSEDQIRNWSNNPDQFVEDEDDDSFSYSVRISAQDLLLSLSSEFPSCSSPALCTAVSKHLHEAEIGKNAGNPNWWKLHESCMLAIGSVKSLVIQFIQENKIQFDIDSFLQSVVLGDLNLQVSPFLIGRCLWTASRFSEIMKPDLLERCIQATVGGLHISQSASVRISAIRALYNYCEQLKNNNNTQLLQPFLINIIDGLITIGTQFSADVLGLALEALTVVISIDKHTTATIENKITPFTIAVYLKHCSDPFLVDLVQGLFKEIAANAGCCSQLEERLLPTIVSILRSPGDKLPGLTSTALDILTTLVRGGQKPLSISMMNLAFPSAIECIMKSDDNDTLQSGGECLRAFCSVDLEQVMQWKDERGKSGLFYIIQVVSKLLDPKTSEGTACFVGRLVSVVISRVGKQLGDDLDLMLRAVLSKLLQAETLSVVQSLVLVFAHLIVNNQLEAVLDFLSSVPSPTGKPALGFVLTEWCSRQHLFYGSYERKISVVALCKLLLHTIQNNDIRLQEITVPGELIQRTDGVKTRSKSSSDPDEWTEIPVLVKIYKLLINELANQLEVESARTGVGEEDEDTQENGWEDDSDNDDGDYASSGHTLSELLNDFGSNYEGIDLGEEEEDDDPDTINDPINQINLQAYLTAFLRQLSQHHCFSMFSAHNNAPEVTVLQAIDVNV
ncbi:hypothetical protein LOTGIDRAFT_219052 [Lottia gigantea]|uniref:Importin N-terminal domain-containing protein n=1 Tax=Lottia gigantea TaxID=225164 RepID=V4A6L1_LOTGI|nr:hypothetical protein LOTGIDRAFT_219052 [Lottia gigantea]ESO88896.1 hypothetical protein LOTGIDRAFT_219052 [Lottia gigantea]